KGKGEARMPATAWLIQDSEQRKHYTVFQQRCSTEVEKPAPDLAEWARASIVTSDLNGNVTGWNQGAARLTGYSASEMLGQNIRVLYPEEARAALRKHICPVLFKDGSLDIDVPLLRKDGSLCHIALALSVITDQSGAQTSVMGVSV